MKLKRFKNVVEGPMGFKMPEVLARAIEATMKGLPKECTYRRIAKDAVEGFSTPGPRQDVSLITTDSVDRDGEVVLPGGMDKSQYGGVVTWCHCYAPTEGFMGYAMGRNLWLKSKPNAIVAATEYYTKPDGWSSDWLPDAIVHAQRQTPAGMTAKSIGFIPVSLRMATTQELAQRPEWKGVPLIDKWKLLEYAVCPVPCNPDAEAVAIGKSVTELDRFTRESITINTKDEADEDPDESDDDEVPQPGIISINESREMAAQPPAPFVSDETLADAVRRRIPIIDLETEVAEQVSVNLARVLGVP